MKRFFVIATVLAILVVGFATTALGHGHPSTNHEDAYNLEVDDSFDLWQHPYHSSNCDPGEKIRSRLRAELSDGNPFDDDGDGTVYDMTMVVSYIDNGHLQSKVKTKRMHILPENGNWVTAIWLDIPPGADLLFVSVDGHVDVFGHAVVINTHLGRLCK